MWGEHRRAFIYYCKQCRSSGQGRRNFHMNLLGFSKRRGPRISVEIRTIQSNDITVHLNYCTSSVLQINLLLCPSESWPKQWLCRISEYYLKFPENSYIFPKHKGDLEEIQTVLSSTSKDFLSMHISCWIKIALNPGLSKLLTLEKPVSSGQRRHNWDTIKRPLVSVSATWNTILVSFSVSKRELANAEPLIAESRVSTNRSCVETGCGLSTSPFCISLSWSDWVPFKA